MTAHSATRTYVRRSPLACAAANPFSRMYLLAPLPTCDSDAYTRVEPRSGIYILKVYYRCGGTAWPIKANYLKITIRPLYHDPIPLKHGFLINCGSGTFEMNSSPFCLDGDMRWPVSSVEMTLAREPNYQSSPRVNEPVDCFTAGH